MPTLHIRGFRTYAFKELKGEGREAALEHLRKVEREFPDSLESWREDCINDMAEMGFDFLDRARRETRPGRPHVKHPALYYSLSYSQGDGVAFEGDIDVLKWLDHITQATEAKGLATIWPAGDRAQAAEFARRLRLYVPADEHPEIRVAHSGNYSHERTMSYEWLNEPEEYVDPDRDLVDGVPPLVQELWNKVEEFVEENVRDQSRRFRKSGYAELEYRQSDECLAEDAEANEWQFLEDGEFVPDARPRMTLKGRLRQANWKVRRARYALQKKLKKAPKGEKVGAG